MKKRNALKVGERHPQTGFSVVSEKKTLRQRFILAALQRTSKSAHWVSKFPGKK